MLSKIKIRPLDPRPLDPMVEGAGLGLSVVYGTMKNLGGTITFANEEGKGALFNIHLPRR